MRHASSLAREEEEEEEHVLCDVESARFARRIRKMSRTGSGERRLAKSKDDNRPIRVHRRRIEGSLNATRAQENFLRGDVPFHTSATRNYTAQIDTSKGDRRDPHELGLGKFTHTDKKGSYLFSRFARLVKKSLQGCIVTQCRLMADSLQNDEILLYQCGISRDTTTCAFTLSR